jgi:hypothetical protein
MGVWARAFWPISACKQIDYNGRSPLGAHPTSNTTPEASNSLSMIIPFVFPRKSLSESTDILLNANKLRSPRQFFTQPSAPPI